MVNIAMCDDSIDELSNMVQLLDEYRISKHLNCDYAVFQNGFDLVSALEKGKTFDLFCLDIIMPAFTGIDLAKEIRSHDKNAPILFFIFSPEFALESYSVNAVNYVLKPLTKGKFFGTMDMVLERMTVERDDAIIVKSNEGIQKILLSSLVYAEVMGRRVFYHLISGKVVKCTESFASVTEKLLMHRSFMKPHRSYIFNMRYIDTIENNKITLQMLSSVPIAQGKTREMKEYYLAFQMEDE